MTDQTRTPLIRKESAGNSPQDEGISFTERDRDLTGLLARITHGDEGALGDLYDKTGSRVYGLAFRILNDVTMAEEVAMDVYLQVWRQAGQFDQSRSRPMVWLTVLTRSRAIDRIRVGRKERARRKPIEDISEEMSIDGNPEQHSVQLEQGRIVRHGLYSLPPEQREVIELGYFEGLSQSEIAQKTGQPLGTVKTRVRLGMIRLRNILGPLHKGFA